MSTTATGGAAAEDAAAALCLMASLSPHEPEQIVPTLPRTSASTSDEHLNGHLFNSTSPTALTIDDVSSASSATNSISTLPSTSAAAAATGFVARVSSIPVVNSAVNKISNMYETSKNSSSIIKFSAETVESSVMKIYRPIQTIVEPQLNDINDFGCKQLDRLQEQFPIVMEQPDQIYQKGASYISSLLSSSSTMPDASSANGLRRSSGSDGESMHVDDDGVKGKRSASGLRRRVLGRRGSQISNGTACADGKDGAATDSDDDLAMDTSAPADGNWHQRKRRAGSSGDSDMAMSPSSSATGTSTVVMDSSWPSSLRGIYGKSYDSLQLVRQTVEVMQAVEMHIERQTTYLSETLRQLQLFLLSQSSSLSVELASQRDIWLNSISSTTTSIRRDIASALRQVVDVISRSATILPAFAQQKVKDFILSLPARWAMGTSTALTAPAESKEAEARFLADGHQMITLSNETRNMLRSLIVIFAQYFDRATAFINKMSWADSSSSQPPAHPSSPNPAAIASLLNHEPSTTPMNGHANGKENGKENGHANGSYDTTNGHSESYSNGHAAPSEEQAMEH